MSASNSTDVDLELVLSVLEDEGSRDLLLAAGQYRAAQELANKTGIPPSTVYRKLDRLSEATLVDERTQVRSDGKHTTQYRTDFKAIRIVLNGLGQFEAAVERPHDHPDEQLADIWGQLREES
jgi:predicted ArsR family transcriptional regulator